MSDKDAVKGMVKRIREAIPRERKLANNPEPEMTEGMKRSIDWEREMQAIGESAVTEVDEQERQEQA